MRSLSVTSLRRAGQGEFGVIVLVDTDATMIGTPLNQAVAAAQALAGQLSGNQQLGIMYGDQLTLPLTTNSAAIQQALSKPPRQPATTHLLRDAITAVGQLKAAHIDAGALIYVSDDIDRDPTYTPQSVGAFATAAHVRVFVVRVHDAASQRPLPEDLPPSSMQVLARAGGGGYLTADPAQLGRVFTAIESGLRSKYLVRYSSLQPLGRTVRVDVAVKGVPGTASFSYSSPVPVAPSRSAPSPAPPRAHAISFWRSSAAVIAVALAVAILLGAATALVVRRFATSEQIRSRVSDFTPDELDDSGGRSVRPTVEGIIEAPAALTRRSWWPGFVEDVDISKIGVTPLRLIQLTGLGSSALAIILLLATGSVLAVVPALLLGPIVLRTLIKSHIRAQRALFSTQLPPHLEEVAGAMRSGRSLVEALAEVVQGADEPTRTEFERALADERLGQPLDETLRPIGARMQSPDVDQLAVIASLGRGSGANVAEVLDHIAEGARQRDELKRELRVMTAQARLTRWILTLLPVAMLLLLTVLRPDYERPLFHTSGGRVFLIAAVVLVGMGSWVMSRIVDIKV